MADGQDKKTVMITGGSTGIGRALVLKFAGTDTRVVFNHFDADGVAAAQTETLAAEAGGWAKGYKVNVAKKDAVRAFFKESLGESGRLDVLVNNAGITKDGLLLRMREEDWDAVLSINLKGAFFCMQEAARIMLRQHFGRIVNVASVVGLTGNPGQANYCAAKAGIIGLTKSAARELAGRGVTVNAVAPGFIDTAMTAAVPEEIRASFVEQTPVKRMGTPAEVAAAVAFLCSEEAGFITGQVLGINGGLYM